MELYFYSSAALKALLRLFASSGLYSLATTKIAAIGCAEFLFFG